MRFSIKKYGDGETYAVETNDDGSKIVREIVGQRRVGQRISSFIEVLGDETPEGADRLLESIEWLKEQVEEKKLNLTERKRKKRVRSAT
jgi:anion-transporting  ArsA/GET3 family ATPase